MLALYKVTHASNILLTYSLFILGAYEDDKLVGKIHAVGDGDNSVYIRSLFYLNISAKELELCF